MQRALFQVLITGLVILYGDVPLFAQQGTGYVVERIEVRGNKKTKPKDRITAALKIVELLGIKNSCNTVIGKVDLNSSEQAYLNGKDPQEVQHLKDLEKYLENNFGDIDEKQIN